jgi:hypothetical protein
VVHPHVIDHFRLGILEQRPHRLMRFAVSDHVFRTVKDIQRDPEYVGCVRMKSLVAVLAANITYNEQECGHPDGQPGDVNYGEDVVLEKAAKGDSKEIPDHTRVIMSDTKPILMPLKITQIAVETQFFHGH